MARKRTFKIKQNSDGMMKLNHLIAEEVNGWKKDPSRPVWLDRHGEYMAFRPNYRPSDDLYMNQTMSMAMELYAFTIESHPIGCQVTLTPNGEEENWLSDLFKQDTQWHSSPAMAICLAALGTRNIAIKFIEVEEE